MEQYIPKAALVAEIKRRMQEHHSGYLVCLKDILSFIDTLEVKEVDLEKELESWRHNHFHGRRDIFANGEYLERISQLDIAKHFYELGIKARTDKELVEEVYSHIDGIKDTADRMTSGNFMHHRAAIKFSANTIATVLELMGIKVLKGEKA